MFVRPGDLAWEAVDAIEVNASIRSRRPHVSTRAKIPVVELAGVQLHAVTEADCVKMILDELDSAKGGVVVTPNLDHLRRCQSDLAFSALVAEADLKVADGMPLIWASRAQGTPLPERVAGSDLISSLSAGAAQRGRSIYLLGGDPGTAEAAAKVLRQRYPELKLGGYYCPPFGFQKHEEEIHNIEHLIRDAHPDIIFVALGSPKQELLIERMQRIVPCAWWLGVGNSFSFLSGNIRRAPMWMQKNGLEWVHRLCQEPRKLFKRYIICGFPFAARLMGQSICRGLPARIGSRGETAPAEIAHPSRGSRIDRALEAIEERRLSGVTVAPLRMTSIPNLRAIILLGGAVRSSRLRQAIGRSILDLPIDHETTLLSHWMHHAQQLGEMQGGSELAVRVMVDRQSEQPVSGPACQSQLRVEQDCGEYRGTGGVLRDIASDYDRDDVILVGNAGQIIPGQLHPIVSKMAEKGADVTLVSHADGTPSGLMLLRCKVLAEIPETGFVDMKEQALPRIALMHDVRVLEMRRPSGFPVRSLGEYIAALKIYHRLRSGMSILTDPLAEDWRSIFNIIEPGAAVEPGARLFDSVVLRGSVVESTAVVVRSVVCRGAQVRPDHSAVDEWVTNEAN